MRWLVGTILGLLALWSAYWVLGSTVISRQIGPAIAGSNGLVQAEGWDVAGFPNRFDLTVTNPVLRGPNGWGWHAEFVQLLSMTWKPWNVIAALPNAQAFDTPYGPANLTSDRFMVSVEVEPKITAGLVEAVLEVETAVLHRPSAAPVALDKLVLAAKHVGGLDYRLGATVAGLGPVVTSPVGGVLEGFRLDAVVSLTEALDRNAAAPAVVAVDLKALSLTRGTMRLNGAGKVVAGPDGYGVGTIEMSVEGWRGLPDVLADFGLVAPELAPTLLRALEIIAKDQGDPEVLKLPLRYEAGNAYLGPLPLGPAPRLG